MALWQLVTSVAVVVVREVTQSVLRWLVGGPRILMRKTGMSFKVPTFNLDVNVWHEGTNPHTDPPSFVTIGQLHFPEQNPFAWGRGSPAPYIFVRYLRLPAATDVRFDPGWDGPIDTVEVPAGSGRFYLVLDVDDVAKGFDNEYRVALIIPSLSWPFPTP